MFENKKRNYIILALFLGAYLYYSIKEGSLILDYALTFMAFIILSIYIGTLFFQEISTKKNMITKDSYFISTIIAIITMIFSYLIFFAKLNVIVIKNMFEDSQVMFISIISICFLVLSFFLGIMNIFYDKKYIVSRNAVVVIKQKIMMHKKFAILTLSVIILLSSVWGYFRFIYREEVDVFTDLIIETQGVSPNGKVVLSEGSLYLKENHPEFWDRLTFEIEENGKLKNEQKIIIKAVPNEQLLEKHRLTILTTEKEYIVENFQVVPKNLAAIKDIQILDKKMRNITEEKYASYSNMQAEVTNACFTNKGNKDNKTKYGTVINVYKVTYDSSFGKATYTTFYAVGYTNITNNADGTLADAYQKMDAFYAESSYTDMIKKVEKYGVNCG